MTPGNVWREMLRKKVFQQWEVVEELARKYSYLSKGYVKMRVQELVRSQVANGVLLKVHDNPPIFALPQYAQNWREHYKTYYKCEVCGKQYIPSMPHQKVCSEACKREHQIRLYRGWRRPEEERARNRRYLPWTRDEDELLKKTFPDLRYSGKKARELAQILKRSPEAIRRRLYELRKKGVRR